MNSGFRFPRGFAGRFNGQLTYVPPNISDLRKLVVLGDKCTMGAGARPITRPFSRTASAPASSSFLHRQNMDSYHRAPGFNHGGARHSTSVGTAQGQQQEAIIQLYLAGNALRSLPREMFSLKGLTVLSLSKCSHYPRSVRKLNFCLKRGQPNRISSTIDLLPHLTERTQRLQQQTPISTR